MEKPTLFEIDTVRQHNLRPNVLACIFCEKKILFMYSKDHNLWQFPQGGIDNNELLDQAFIREMSEELGSEFTAQLSKPEIFLYKEVFFEEKLHGSRPLKTDDGKEITMKGKAYYIVFAKSKTEKLEINKTEFDDYAWVSHAAAYQLINDIYQPQKKDLYVKILYTIAKRYPELI